MAKRVKAAVGVDSGGTYTKVGAISTSGKILLETQIPAEVSAGPKQFAGRVATLVDSWRKGHGLDLVGLGLGIAGDVDSEKGMLRLSPNLPGWDGFNFAKALGGRLRVPVVVENDANAAVWGGYAVELKRKPRDVVGVTLGTGVGGGLVIERRLYRGSTGSAGEIGHTVVEAGGAPCHCGWKGCLEAYAGSYGIVRLAREIAAKDPARARILTALCPDLARLEPKHLSEAADEGDAAARETWDRVGSYLAVGLANMVLVLNPDVILILGGVSRAGHWLLDPIEKHFARQPFGTAFGHVRVKFGLGNKAGWMGAAMLAMETGA